MTVVKNGKYSASILMTSCLRPNYLPPGQGQFGQTHLSIRQNERNFILRAGQLGRSFATSGRRPKTEFLLTKFGFIK